jgi:hypothetical protein
MYAAVLLHETGFLVPPCGVTLDESMRSKIKSKTFELRISSLVEQRELI